MTVAPRRTTLFAVIAVLALALLAPGGIAASSSRTLEGTLRLAHGDDYSGGAGHGSGVWDYSLATSSGSVRLAFSGGSHPDGFLNGAHVRVTGSLVGATLAVGSNRADAQVVSSVQASVSGTRSVALLLVNFILNPAQPWTTAQANGVLFANTNSVANYFAEESYGQLNVTGSVFGYYTIDYDITTCDYTLLASKARAAATAAGVNLGSFTNVQYAFPSLPCGWSGLAYLPGTETWLNNALTLGVSAHELSHNFGVHHASTVNCVESGVRVSLSANLANCSYSEYGDPFSVMGNAGGGRHTHSQQLATLGWASGSSLVTASTNGTYTLGAAEDAASAIKAIRVARGDGTYLYLELREPWGTSFDNFGASDPVVKGVSLRISNDWSTIIQSKLIDATPATGTYADAALAAGASFTDPVSGVTVATNSVAGGVASVSLDWGADLVAPSTPTGLSARSTGATTATLTWNASTDNRGVAGYRVTRGGVTVGSPSGTSFADSGLTGGQAYAYTVTAFDDAGNWSGVASLSWTQPSLDTTAPSAPTNLHTSAFSKTKLTLAWTASTDNLAVAGYRIYRNGVLWATTTATSYSGNRQNKVFTYTVVAFDAAGNSSAPSAGFRV